MSSKKICPYCGFEDNRASYTKCYNCNQPIDNVSVEENTITEVVISPKVSCDSATNFRLCPFCREEIKADAIKCKHCGESLIAPKTVRQPTQIDQSGSSTIKKWGNWIEAILAIIFLGFCANWFFDGTLFTSVKSVQKEARPVFQELLDDARSSYTPKATVRSVDLVKEGWFSNKYEGYVTVTTGRKTANLAVIVRKDNDRMICEIEPFQLLKLWDVDTDFYDY